MKLKIGFPYFFHAYHAYHSAPIGFELSRLDTDLEIKFITTTKECNDLLNKIGSHYQEHRCSIHLLPSRFSDYFQRFAHRQIPSPGRMIKRHARKFKSMDVIIDTNFLSLRLKQYNPDNTAKYILTNHGAGDRDREFPMHLKQIDFFLLYGPKKFRRLNGMGYLGKDNWGYIGYPKFDILLNEKKVGTELFQARRPIVLYNPHFEHHLTSWFDWGKDILDYFALSKQYNLIFAPHVELKGRSNPSLSLKKYAKIPNIHIDLGSHSSIDMSYTKMADLYIGDVSSQIVEYLVHPRPCVFLNNHKISWKDNSHYIHWKLGHVVDQISQLDNTIQDSFRSHKQFHSTQVEYFNDSIQLTDTPSGLRAAQVILNFLKRMA
ncbi:MAG: CDP-glycerol glycerophosphotransferase family protein [Candidatus Marinimicrobia bacterium]|nr:CDP-glycerol glycerophosphotransferase family protein [Candidatus Neomarinimicrobiota bacterium]MCH7762358.1 CDP-glycerol glycerophosphotransferase family protein [Candidatus Neomarinimicrobiota bacterium]